MNRACAKKQMVVLLESYLIYEPEHQVFLEELCMRQETDGVLLESYLIYEPEHQVFLEELRMRQETDGVLLESYLIYEPEHQVFLAEWRMSQEPDVVLIYLLFKLKNEDVTKISKIPRGVCPSKDLSTQSMACSKLVRQSF
jgi:hypothetical protein